MQIVCMQSYHKVAEDYEGWTSRTHVSNKYDRCAIDREQFDNFVLKVSMVSGRPIPDPTILPENEYKREHYPTPGKMGTGSYEIQGRGSPSDKACLMECHDRLDCKTVGVLITLNRDPAKKMWIEFNPGEESDYGTQNTKGLIAHSHYR
ncbi:hypothetical protein Pcinc_017942 [Petrolisthes cinctipes]|uniref:Uncharacterized protein n=1 Tax=Petrolisthes cinctipes TaxID=88211 RepID=A0AAE1KNA3_PETCI|nr:hypothetical protein Pcinc_017942 [Petrolisthes cinctipes]